MKNGSIWVIDNCEKCYSQTEQSSWSGIPRFSVQHPWVAKSKTNLNMVGGGKKNLKTQHVVMCQNIDFIRICSTLWQLHVKCSCTKKYVQEQVDTEFVTNVYRQKFSRFQEDFFLAATVHSDWTQMFRSGLQIGRSGEHTRTYVIGNLSSFL